MKFLLLLFALGVVTRVPGVTSQLYPVISGSTGSATSKIIRVFGNSFIAYDLDVLTQEMASPVHIESVSLQFISRDREGLMWLYENENGQRIHMSLKRNGQILFAISGGSASQQVTVQPLNRQRLNDFVWHTITVEKNNTVLRFFLDGVEVTSAVTNREIQLMGRGKLYLGGSPPGKTNNLVRSNFDGALTDVESRKFTRPARELIISFLQIVDQTEQGGDVTIFDKKDWNSGNWTWLEVTTPTTTPTTTTRRPALPTPVTFTSASSVLFLEPLDMRRGGSVSFRFRTLQPRGLLAIARGSAQSVNFVAIEIFDGILYFVSDFGSFSSRKQFTDSRVDDGQWHTVTMSFENNRMILELDETSFPTILSQSDINKLYFYRLYIGGYDNFNRIPWPLYSRVGYRGCLEALKVNDVGVDLHSRFRDTNIQGMEMNCRTMPLQCASQPCVSGFCKDTMDGYVCDCASTPYTGRNCSKDAVVASWDGTYFTNFEFNNRQVRHTNDLSFRFATPLRNTLLFKTEVDRNDDFLQAELENGRAKVTIHVGGQRKVFYSGSNLNDYDWHTLYIRRRADDMEVWVDSEPRMVGIIGGEDYKLNIDRIRFGALKAGGTTTTSNYIGYMQNFIYEDRELFNELRQQNTNVKWRVNISPGKLPLITYKPVTITSSQTYFQLPALRIGLSMKLLFKFKTRESNGLILYNAGSGNDALAVELSNGRLRLAYNLGGTNRFTIVPTATTLNDNQWHTVQVTLNNRGQFTVAVDDTAIDEFASDGDGQLNLSENLYIAGLPAEMFERPRIQNLITSRKGLRGCLASVDLNGAVPELLNFAPEKHHILNGCTDLDVACKPNVCGPGVCVAGLDDYTCDCDMTGYIGIPCSDEPTGYYFGKNGEKGMVVYEYPFEHQTDSDLDKIAFGFMTYEENGVLMRLQSSLANEYIEIRLENGHVVAESKTGQNIIRVIENSDTFNDGLYHVVRYIRTGTNTTLQVDNMDVQQAMHSGAVSVFDKVYLVMLGGKRDSKGAMANNFYGIIGGAYWNGHRWLDMLYKGQTLHQKLVQMKGKVDYVKPFLLVKGGGGNGGGGGGGGGGGPSTAGPPDVVIPPGEGIPDTFGGGGYIGPGTSIGGEGGGAGGGMIAIGGPGGLTGFTGGSGVFTGGAPVPLASAMLGPAPPPMAVGARAGAVVGTIIGTMAFMSSLMWALYKLKPGVPTCLSPGAGSAGAGAGSATPMSISPPRATSNLAAVQAASAGGGGSAGGGAGVTKVAVVNGGAGAGGAGAGGAGGSSTFTSYFSSTSTTVGGGEGGGAGGVSGGGADAFDSATLRATGTFSNKGTTIGTPKAVRANLGSSSSAYSANYASHSATISGYGSGQTSPGYGAGYMTTSSAGANIPDYDIATGSGALATGQSYSTSTLNTNYNYQVQNLKTVTINRQGQYVLTSGSTSGAVTPGAAADEVRVDCCLMTKDGRSVVTGSSAGPPQAWDMQNGELLRIMKGDTIGSTNLHLVCGDRLLVGAVHADLEINEFSGRKGVFNHTLQIWDFVTGKPLSMAEGEYCSALCPMSDSDKVLFGRTDKFGDATSIIAWDLMGNQPIKEMRYDGPVGNNDYIHYLNMSKNDRYVVAGFTNSFDNYTEFMVFDMTLTSFLINEPSMLRLDANADCTAILPKDEAVTGLRNGDLVIWSLRTGQPSRQLLSGGGAHAHTREVKAVTLSDDGKYLVSASADGTLKVWDMHTERPIHTLTGHSDEVWCCSISPDNEIVVSGSNDGTIRLWRLRQGNEMCVFNTAVDIFFVTMSHDKGTIVALGDKYGARKLIMLQVVRTKVKKIISS